MRESLKPIVWLGDSLDRVRAFSKPARQQAGYELETIQHGMDPSDWKPMPTIGAGVREIRIHAGAEHRVFYVVRFERSIYVLHAFVKKTRKTTGSAIRLGVSRYREALKREGLA